MRHKLFLKIFSENLKNQKLWKRWVKKEKEKRSLIFGKLLNMDSGLIWKMFQNPKFQTLFLSPLHQSLKPQKNLCDIHSQKMAHFLEFEVLKKKWYSDEYFLILQSSFLGSWVSFMMNIFIQILKFTFPSFFLHAFFDADKFLQKELTERTSWEFWEKKTYFRLGSDKTKIYLEKFLKWKQKLSRIPKKLISLKF